jgi:hypothetical protein
MTEQECRDALAVLDRFAERLKSDREKLDAYEVIIRALRKAWDDLGPRQMPPWWAPDVSYRLETHMPLGSTLKETGLLATKKICAKLRRTLAQLDQVSVLMRKRLSRP